MDDSQLSDGMPTLDSRADLQTILAAWQVATARLEQTHEALRSEVGRLTHEVEIKNRELARKNRLADLGQIASHIAHEVRNNLVPVKLYLSLLRRRLSEDAGSLDVLAKINAGFMAMDATVEDLLHFSADRDPHCETVLLRALMEDVQGSLAPQLAAQRIAVRVDVPAGQCVWADRNMLRRAMLNLMLNALDAMPNGGELSVISYHGPQGVELEIADSGGGLSEESQRRAFEPFYTTKSSGTGLGLAIVYHIAQVHGGNAVAENCPDGGAAFTLRFPDRIPGAKAA